MKFTSFALFSLAFAPVALSYATGAESNAKRMARGLPPLPPRRLYNAKVVRGPAPSQTPGSPATLPTVAAYVTNVVTGAAAAPTKLYRRQNVGAVAGYLNQVAQITTTNHNVKFSLTTDDAASVHGLYPTDYQQPTASQPISEFICLANGHSVDQSRDQPITLSPTTGEYLYFGDCGGDLDQPAGSPPTHDASAVEPEYYAATRVWKVDSTTGAITFEYVNPDGSIPTGQTAVTFWCPEYGAAASSSSVFVTSNPQLFRDAFVEKYKSELQDPDSCYVNELAFFYTSS